MGTDHERHLIRQMLQRLKRDKRGFGERPHSYYVQCGQEPFVTYVLNLNAVQLLLPYQTTGNLQDLLTSEQQRHLKEIVDRVDQHGALVSAWSHGHAPPGPCLSDLERRLRFWAFRHVPGYCWARLRVPQVVDALLDGIGTNIASYGYTTDLMVWALPLLLRTLWVQIRKSSEQTRGSLDIAELRQQLLPAAQAILDRIQESHGVHGIRADEVTDRAVHLVMLASPEEYAVHRADIFQWALGNLKHQIKLQIPFRVEPNMGPDWYHDPGEETAELRKRRGLLQAFFDTV